MTHASPRDLPSVDRLLREPRTALLAEQYSRGQVVEAIRELLGEWRERARRDGGCAVPEAPALAAGREVVISRGQLVEIGGGFRIPDVLRQSGARLVEVGTTNRTYAADYRQAVGPETALLLRVHSSNFRVVGFVHEASIRDLA